MSLAGAMLVAMALDALLGWPDAVYRRIGHPVTWAGRLIALLDRRWNDPDAPCARRRSRGVAATLITVGLALGLGWLVQAWVPGNGAGTLILGVLAWPLIALRSMHDHVQAVARPLARSDLPAARHAVAMIVGRDPARLDSAGVARAATESLAENTSDGILAPLFWGVVAGLPGIAAYKAINTLDSMIGHLTPRHGAFGWAAARLDDVVNWVPARLTGLIFALVSGAASRALRCMARDARNHRSPNAGWPEAAMAGALGVRLSGPRIYGDTVSAEPWVNEGAPDPTPQDLTRALALYRRAMIAVAVGVLALMAGTGW